MYDNGPDLIPASHDYWLVQDRRLRGLFGRVGLFSILRPRAVKQNVHPCRVHVEVTHGMHLLGTCTCTCMPAMPVCHAYHDPGRFTVESTP